MKLKNTLLLVFGVASSAVIAQPSQPQMPSGSQVQTQPSASGQPGQSTSQGQPLPQSDTQSEGQSDTQSSGAGGPSQSGTSPESSTGEASSSGSGEQSSGIENLPPPAPMTQLEPKTESGFTYLCGGVGAEEAQQLKQAARDYDMMLTFTTRKGNYLADVNVNIKDQQGKTALTTTCDGPLMLVDFPRSGTYRIQAETGGYTLNKTAHVRAKGRSHAALVMAWPQQVATTAEAVTPSTGSSGSNGGNGGNGSTNAPSGNSPSGNNGTR